MIILFLLTGLTGIGLVHLQNSRDRAQRKEEAIAALESVPTITPTPVATVTPTPTPVPTATPTAAPTATPTPTSSMPKTGSDNTVVYAAIMILMISAAAMSVIIYRKHRNVK